MPASLRKRLNCRVAAKFREVPLTTIHGSTNPPLIDDLMALREAFRRRQDRIGIGHYDMERGWRRSIATFLWLCRPATRRWRGIAQTWLRQQHRRADRPARGHDWRRRRWQRNRLDIGVRPQLRRRLGF